METVIIDNDTKLRIKEHRQSINTPKVSHIRRAWLAITWCLTWYIPSFFLSYIGRMKSESVQIAWREKLALNILIFLCSGMLLFVIIFLPMVLCPNLRIMSQFEIEAKSSLQKPYISAYGMYYLIPEIVKTHVFEQYYLNEQAFKSTVLGRDVSAMFSKVSNWNDYCQNLPLPPNGWDNIKREIPEDVMTVWTIHKSAAGTKKTKNYLESIKKMQKGLVARDKIWISNYLQQDPVNNYMLVAYNRIYEMTQYMNPVQKPTFLGKNIAQIISTAGKNGQDATMLLEQIKSLEGVEAWKRYMNCIDAMFLVGAVDHRQSTKCIVSDYIVLSASMFMIIIIGFKFLAALQIQSDSNPEEQDKFVICCVPCYTEGIDSLKVTINSLALTTYPNNQKIIFVVCDGMVKGVGNDKFTPDIVLDILGCSGQQPPCRSYIALGDDMKQLNMAQVYSGQYLINNQSIPYVVVVKTGDLSETVKPGNRGKRDSQMILMRYLSRAHLMLDMSPLELELHYHFLHRLCLDPRNFEFLLWVDSDTEIFPDSLSRYISYLTNDSKIAGLCGETLLRNEGESWTTMIQVYEYFITHHLSKSFESLFGTVTCLPGCFSIYRIWSVSDGTPILISPKIIDDYGVNDVNTLHLKNLLSLGEDRYLTTLLLKNFPQWKLKFYPDAKAKTNAPEKWSVLMSQRRRWINSTVHNLAELLLLTDLCGCFIFSIRFVVFMDLFGTVMSPAGFVYVVWLIVTLIVDDSTNLPLISIIMLCAVYGLQVVIFVLKREWQHIGWMIIYILAMPFYSFWLPIYSFWKMDDFSWGSTRNVMIDDNDQQSQIKRQEVFDPNMVPTKSWALFVENDLSWRKELEIQ
jgi:chitin synthase